MLSASTEEGQKDLRTTSNIRKAIKIEELEKNGGVVQEAPLDFSRMTQEQYERWVKEQEALLG